ncbi:hypothetical protein MLD38_028539 [Melastoma candidum]|uniref:Uncharacterized protein n=1 Tax=Melastoma candidum TaxID=119954 RepID=A0ACB9N266_9MYRT|nr:hypothetical protein MLD38_028539 [Melastoma candidum]
MRLIFLSSTTAVGTGLGGSPEIVELEFGLSWSRFGSSDPQPEFGEYSLSLAEKLSGKSQGRRPGSKEEIKGSGS